MKYMQIEIDKILNLNKDKIIILDWLLLLNTKYFNMCDVKILLDVSYDVRKKRAMKRDNITEEDFDLREQATIDFDETLFDYVFKAADEKKVERLAKLL